jgi:hypothetical protein
VGHAEQPGGGIPTTREVWTDAAGKRRPTQAHKTGQGGGSATRTHTAAAERRANATSKERRVGDAPTTPACTQTARTENKQMPLTGKVDTGHRYDHNEQPEGDTRQDRQGVECVTRQQTHKSRISHRTGTTWGCRSSNVLTVYQWDRTLGACGIHQMA